MNLLPEIVRREIAQCGVMPFARFMELALYCPKHGYYETNKDNPGRRGDFYTSVGVGELFGQLLAFQFAGWLEGAPSADGGAWIVEAGAHDGKLAKDILSWLRSNRPGLFGRVEYGIVEPSPTRQEWQRATLTEFAPRVRWFDRLNDSTNRRFNGILFGNELLDSMPVRRFGWSAKDKRWFEWGVVLDGDKFAWAKIAQPESSLPSAIRELPSSLLPVLPDVYTIETSPAAESWWRDAAHALQRGRLMTIDYGLAAGELFSPSRPQGTLRAYFRHHASEDLLANVGEQDLTAHVNFSAIQAAGESTGLETESLQTQSQFLTRILANAAQDCAGEEWIAAHARQFQTLTHPEHLGRAFRVLVQLRR